MIYFSSYLESSAIALAVECRYLNPVQNAMYEEQRELLKTTQEV
jgi:hypothetical protein